MSSPTVSQPMTSQPIPPTIITPPEPLVRSCATIVDSARAVYHAAFGTPDPSAPRYDDPLDQVRTVNPALADALAPMLDAVIELDSRTGFLGGTY
jgi:hypothetical protein